MGLSSAMNTSLNGLALNELTIDVLGNNIANASTNGFKSSQALFATQLARTLSIGSRPTAASGGTNPRQIGLGASVTTIRKDFTSGSITNSTNPSDLAIQGDGFFILDGPEGNVYTRNGNFTLNANNLLVTPTGLRVQGYAVDDEFQLITTQLSDLTIPLGSLNIAQQTSVARLGGALLSTGEVGTQGSLLTSEAMIDNSTGLAITGASLLSDVENSLGESLFTVGETLSFSPRKGGRVLEAQSMAISAATTMTDLLNFMDAAMGIQSGGAIPDDGTTGTQPGLTITAGGEIQILGNMGEFNNLNMVLGDMTTETAPVNITFLSSQGATGESASADLVVHDSLGQPISLTLTTVLESRNSTSTTFRYFVESAEDSDLDTAVATGTITFDSRGRIIDNTSTPGVQTITIDRMDTAALSPLQIDLDFRNVSGLSSEASGSSITLQSQDGSSPGTLTSFVIDEAGLINGVFDNGVIRVLGQVTLARFPNTQGLLEAGDTTFREGVSSGSPFLVSPATFGAGAIRSGAIELSNTDLGKNLVDLILASTNYRGNARVISSVQELVDELLVLGR